MIRRVSFTVFTAASAALVASLLATDANAGRRHKIRFHNVYQNYYSGPEYVPVPRFYKYFVDPGEMTPEEFDQAYGDDFDDTYYQPSYVPPPAKPKPLKKKPAVATPAARPVAKKTVSEAVKPKTAPALSCDKATGIVSGYGFSSVKASDCEGQVYAFNAARAGKSYAIKLNAVSGELTEVRKIQ
jgi:hypothetical protein